MIKRQMSVQTTIKRIFALVAIIIVIVDVLGIGQMLFGIFFSGADTESNWNPFDYVRVVELDYRAVVVDEPDSRGMLHVTERITFDVHAFSRGNLFWELWRALPEGYYDGVKVHYDVLSVKQVFDDKDDVVFAESPQLYWDDSDFTMSAISRGLGPGKWYHSPGPYNPNLRLYECVLFYVNGLYRETVVFEIEYLMYNAALRYGDASELYISLYDDPSIKYLTKVTGEILIPSEIMPRAGNYTANTYGTNAHEFPFDESTTKNPGFHTFSFELDESQLKFRPYNQWIEFSLIAHGGDRHRFTEHASRNTYYDSDMLASIRRARAEYDALPAKYARMKVDVLVWLSLTTILAMVLLHAIVERKKKKYNFFKPATPFKFFREIPSEMDPIFSNELVFCRHKLKTPMDDGYAAVMLSLIQKGYVELERMNISQDWSNKNMRIVVKHRPYEGVNPLSAPMTASEENAAKHYLLDRSNSAPVPDSPGDAGGANSNLKSLTDSEENYFNLILRHTRGQGFWISLADFQKRVSDDYSYTDSFVSNIKSALTRTGINEGYFQQNNYKKLKEGMCNVAFGLAAIGVLIMVVCNLISYQTRLDFALGAFFILGGGFIAGAIYLLKCARECVLLTQFGEDEYAKWRGLYNFLSSETLMNERTVIELALWERYLVYATAWGISKKVIKAMQIRCPQMVEASPVLRNRFIRTSAFRSYGHSVGRATRTASFTMRGGGHGGFGGGGRGGGGGGGGH